LDFGFDFDFDFVPECFVSRQIVKFNCHDYFVKTFDGSNKLHFVLIGRKLKSAFLTFIQLLAGTSKNIVLTLN
jgi:hypothetical protein